MLDGENILAPGTDLLEPAPSRRDDLPEAQPVPDDRLRQHRLRLAHAFPPEQVGAVRARRRRAQAGGALGRGQAQARRAGPGAVGRPAAAALHRSRHRGRAGGDPHGRALLGDRPRRPPPRSRSSCSSSSRSYTIVHRHAQHAAGGARLRLHGLLLRGAHRRVRGRRRQIFENPREKQTEDYITGRFG